MAEYLPHKRKKALSYYLILFIILPAAICLYLYAAHFRAVGLIHDDGIYLVCAKSLCQGTGYSIVSLPGSPPQTKYPPVLSLILSLLWRINPAFPENILVMRLFSALCAALVLPLAWFYLRLKSDYTVFPSLLFLSALAFNPYFALLAGQVMSEMPFTLFSLASIVFFLHYERSRSKTSLYASLLLAIIAFYTRTIGIALFLSFLFWFLYQRQFKAFFLFLALVFLATIPWFYWAYTNAPASNSLVSAYYSSYLSWFLLAVRSSGSYVPNPLGFSLPGLLCPALRVHSVNPTTILSLIFAVSFLLFFLKGILYQFRKSPSVDTFYLLITMVIVAVWSLGIEAERLLVPVLPMVLFYLIEGVRAVRKDITTLPPLYKKITRPMWLASVTVLLVGIFIVTIPHTINLIRQSYFNNEDLFCRMEESFDWIKNNTKRVDVIACPFDPLAYLLSGRLAVSTMWVNPFVPNASFANAYDEDDILEAIEKYRVNYLHRLYGKLRWEHELSDKKLAEIIRKYPGAFAKNYEKEESFAIYRVNSQHLKNKSQP